MKPVVRIVCQLHILCAVPKIFPLVSFLFIKFILLAFYTGIQCILATLTPTLSSALIINPPTHFLTNILSLSCLFILICGPLRLVVDKDCVNSVVVVEKATSSFSFPMLQCPISLLSFCVPLSFPSSVAFSPHMRKGPGTELSGASWCAGGPGFSS